MARKNSKERRRQRERLAERDGMICYWCKCELSCKADVTRRIIPPPRFPTIDHVIEKWRGGDNTDANCVLACPPCNNDRTNKPKNFKKGFGVGLHLYVLLGDTTPRDRRETG